MNTDEQVDRALACLDDGWGHMMDCHQGRELIELIESCRETGEMRWVEVKTYAELVEAAGDGAHVIRSWVGAWRYRVCPKLDAANRSRAERGHRIGAKTEVLRLDEPEGGEP